MKAKLGTIIPLTIVVAIAFILRVMPYHAVFGGGFVSFIETDSYNQMGIAEKITQMSFWSALQYTVANNTLWPATVALFGHVFNIESVGAWLPLILGCLTVVMVYAIGRLIFNKTVGFVAALFTAIIPSEFLNRTLLGYADHHAMEAFLMATTVFCLLKAIKNTKIINRWTLLTSLSLLLFLCNWTGGMVLAGMILVFALIVSLIWVATRKQEHKTTVLATSFAVASSVLVYLVLGGWHRYVGLFTTPETAGAISAGVGAPTAQVFGEGLATFFAPLSSRTISEIMPLLFPFGSFNIGVVITNLNLFAIAFVAGLLIIILRMPNSKEKWLLLTWTGATLLMSLDMRRFLYYFTVNVALISAYCIVWVADRFKGDRALNISALLLPVMFVSFFFASLIAKGGYIQMSSDWHQALVYLKSQPVGVVTAWSDYGHWIAYETKDTPNALPGPGGTEIAQLYLSTSNDQAEMLMKQLGTEYLIADASTINQKLAALYTVAGSPPATLVKDTLIYRLMSNANVPPNLSLIYENQELRIYRVN